MNMTSIYSLVATEFPDNREKYFGYIELCLGMGMFFGPFISGVLYQYLNYFGTFMLFASFLAVGLVFALTLLPSRLNNTNEENSKLLKAFRQE